MPLVNNSQLNQINEMNASEMAKQLAIDSYDKHTWIGITNDIQSGKYNSVGSISYCNIFLDDVLKKYYGITVPRRKEFKESFFKESTSSGDFKGWEDNPVSASTLEIFFRHASKLPKAGVTKVDAMEGSNLSAQGKPVIVLGRGHATLAAPHQKWPLVYRSDQSRRGSDTRLAVGVKKDSGLSFYAIDPKKYKKFRGILSKFTPEDVMIPSSENGKKLRKQLEEIK